MESHVLLLLRGESCFEWIEIYTDDSEPANLFSEYSRQAPIPTPKVESDPRR
ncbi:MAG: hypothetical protein ABI051_18580 [Vicinamibacterales bacterium]